MKPVLVGIACIVAISWIYLLAGAGMPAMDMGGGNVMVMPPPSWSIGYASVIFAMWTVMMVAMMLPTPAPVILRLAGSAEKQPTRASGISSATFFIGGYLLVWLGFSAAATMAQWAFDSAHLLSDSMAIRSEAAAGLLVIAVGLYQLSPVKRTCLRRCCSSNNFLANEQAQSASAAARAGLTYGISCLGCCWAMMCLLFVVGVMNIFWIAAITICVLSEKTLPRSLLIARVTAAGLIGWGSVALAAAIR